MTFSSYHFVTVSYVGPVGQVDRQVDLKWTVTFGLFTPRLKRQARSNRGPLAVHLKST